MCHLYNSQSILGYLNYFVPEFSGKLKVLNHYVNDWFCGQVFLPACTFAVLLIFLKGIVAECFDGIPTVFSLIFSMAAGRISLASVNWAQAIVP